MKRPRSVTCKRHVMHCGNLWLVGSMLHYCASAPGTRFVSQLHPSIDRLRMYRSETPHASLRLSIGRSQHMLKRPLELCRLLRSHGVVSQTGFYTQ